MTATLTTHTESPPERRKSRYERRFGFTRRFGQRRRRDLPVAMDRRQGDRRAGTLSTRRSGADRRGFLGLKRAIDLE